jgi:hypothetical protein
MPLQTKGIVELLKAHKPHLVLLGTGMDNHELDHATMPPGVGGLQCKDQSDLVRWIRKALPFVRIVCAQEGGYAVQGRSAGSLPRSVYALVSESRGVRCRSLVCLLLPSALLAEGGRCQPLLLMTLAYCPACVRRRPTR